MYTFLIFFSSTSNRCTYFKCASQQESVVNKSNFIRGGGEELLNYQNEAKPSSNFSCLFCPLSKYSCSYICNPLMHTYKYFASKLLCSTSHTAVKFLLRLLSYLDVFEQVCRCGCCCMLSHVSEQKSTSFTSLVYLSTKSLLQLPDTANNHDGDGLPRGTICISGRRGLCKRKRIFRTPLYCIRCTASLINRPRFVGIEGTV